MESVTSFLSSAISRIAASALHGSPSEYITSWLLYLGIQTHVGHTSKPDMKPLHNVCEYLNALHIYADAARRGEVRTVDAHHFCSHVRKDLRQCLIYDSCAPDARLIGVEYMIPRARYLTLPAAEQRLWHSHEFEVSSGMLALPYPASHAARGRGRDAWDALETEAMREVVGLYGKLFHFWDVDRGDDLPLGLPRLMGSLTGAEQLDVDAAMAGRNRDMGIDTEAKRRLRAGIEMPGVHENADSWWTEAKSARRGIYA